jgi:HPt (histidine-containing phosphotransfer) domain-containing protein
MKTEHLNFHIIESVCLQMQDEAAGLAFWRESLGLSLESLEKNVTRMEHALGNKDAMELAHIAHKINGTISFLGGTAISERMIELQDECEQNRISWPLHDEAAIRTVLAIVINEIKAAREKKPQST